MKTIPKMTKPIEIKNKAVLKEIITRYPFLEKRWFSVKESGTEFQSMGEQTVDLELEDLCAFEEIEDAVLIPDEGPTKYYLNDEIPRFLSDVIEENMKYMLVTKVGKDQADGDVNNTYLLFELDYPAIIADAEKNAKEYIDSVIDVACED